MGMRGFCNSYSCGVDKLESKKYIKKNLPQSPQLNKPGSEIIKVSGELANPKSSNSSSN